MEIDVAKCSCVVRFDLPQTVRSYIQSRGRARHKDSRYITMLERGNAKQIDHMVFIIRSEYSMIQTAKVKTVTSGADKDETKLTRIKSAIDWLDIETSSIYWLECN